MDEDVGVESGKWTEEENAILLQLLVDNPEMFDEDKKKNTCNVTILTERYNECINLASKALGITGLKVRTEPSIDQKLSHFDRYFREL